MELKAGYKQSDVGVIPADWVGKRLGDLGRVIRGASPRPKGDKRYYGGNIPRLMVEDVTRDGKYVIPIVDFLTEEGAKRSRPCRKGTLTIVCSGTVGIPSFLAVEACIHDGFLALVNIDGSITVDYIYHQLMILRSKFENSATHGGIFTNLTTTILNDFKIPIPPSTEEQQAISVALSDVEALITGLDRLIAKKRDIKQAAMHELLTGKRRLPGFVDNERFKKTAIDEIPRDWDLRSFGDVAEVIMGQSPAGTSYNNMGAGIPLINGPTEFTDKYPIKIQWTTQPTKTCKDGDLLLCVRGSSTGRMNISDGMYCIGRGVAAIRAKSGSDTRFLTYLLHSAIQRLLSFSTGSTFPNIDRKSISSIQIDLPPFSEQQSIATVLSDMDAEIFAIENRRHKTFTLMQGMMQELLTGRIRLVQGVEA